LGHHCGRLSFYLSPKGFPINDLCGRHRHLLFLSHDAFLFRCTDVQGTARQPQSPRQRSLNLQYRRFRHRQPVCDANSRPDDGGH